MDVSGVRQGIADAAATIPGMRGMAYLRDSLEPPVFVAGEVTLDFDKTFRAGRAGLVEGLFLGRLYVSRADDRTGQERLDSYLLPDGAQSIMAAIESDRTLGGNCKTLHVERIHGYGIYDVAGTSFFGAQFDIRVWG
jgi:hypothetical protein